MPCQPYYMQKNEISYLEAKINMYNMFLKFYSEHQKLERKIPFERVLVKKKKVVAELAEIILNLEYALYSAVWILRAENIGYV